MILKQKKKKLNEENHTKLALIFVLPYLLPFILFSVVPIVLGVLISLCDYNPYALNQTKFVGFDNYAMLFKSNILSKLFWESFLRTITFDLVAVPCLIIIPLALASLVNIKPFGYKFFRAVIYLPSIVSITIVGIAFGAIFSSSEQGLFNAVFNTNIPFLADDFLRWTVILLASIWWQTGTNFVILLAALKDVPVHLYEASEIDGCSKWKSFLHVTLPNIKGSLTICMFTTLIGYLNLYGQPTVLNSAINQGNIDSPMILIRTWLSDNGKARLTGLITATAIFFGLIVMAVTGIQSFVMRERKGRTIYEKRYKEYLKNQC